MPSIMETGFVSAEQEQYLMKQEPDLYKAILKKHGHFGKAKKRITPNSSSQPSFSSRMRRGTK